MSMVDFGSNGATIIDVGTKCKVKNSIIVLVEVLKRAAVCR